MTIISNRTISANANIIYGDFVYGDCMSFNPTVIVFRKSKYMQYDWCLYYTAE